jgi:hypothetical protein
MAIPDFWHELLLYHLESLPLASQEEAPRFSLRVSILSLAFKLAAVADASLGEMMTKSVLPYSCGHQPQLAGSRVTSKL